MAAEDRNGEVSTQGERTEPTTREHSFDTLTRGLANGSISRRKALRVLGASLAGSVMAAIPGAAIAAPPPTTCLKETKPCKTNTDCCSQNCETRNGKLVCGPAVQCTGQGQGNCPQPASQCLQILCSASGFCGAPQAKPNNTPCDTDNNRCTLDTCQSGVCTPGGLKTCPASTDPCKVNVCNPATGDCVTQNAPNNTPCEDGDLCTLNDTCQNGTCRSGAAKTCPSSNNPCVARTECNPVTGDCVEIAGNAGTECRPAQGDCDLPALCTGASTTCPDNPLKAAGTVCREAAGPCDVAEVCTGTSNQCPNNEFLPAGTVCLEAQGPCAGPSLCSGNGAQCPENPLLPNTTICRPAANNQCDVPEFCTGNSNQCPQDVFRPNGTPCDRDNNLCTLDTCQNGVCQAGSQVQCPTPTNPCKVSVCAPATGTCVEQNAPNTTSCSTDLCRTGQTCNNGTCQGGTPRTCPTCTTCSAATGTCVPVTCPTTGNICCPPGSSRAGTCGVPLGAACTSTNSNCCAGTCNRNMTQPCRPQDTGCTCR